MLRWPDEDQRIFAKRNPQDDAQTDRRADMESAAGRYVVHAKVAEWLKTWRTEAEHPITPKWLEWSGPAVRWPNSI